MGLGGVGGLGMMGMGAQQTGSWNPITNMASGAMQTWNAGKGMLNSAKNGIKSMTQGVSTAIGQGVGGVDDSVAQATGVMAGPKAQLAKQVMQSKGYNPNNTSKGAVGADMGVNQLSAAELAQPPGGVPTQPSAQFAMSAGKGWDNNNPEYLGTEGSGFSY